MSGGYVCKKGPCQPKDHYFKHNEDDRAFRAIWYKKFGWLEISVAKSVAYCFFFIIFISRNQ